MGLQACNFTKKRLHRRFPVNIVNFNNTNFKKHLRTADSLSSYILHRKLNKIIQEADWPSRLAFCFFWNIKSLYFTYSRSYPFVLSLVVTCCTTLCHSLSLDVPLVSLFINDPIKTDTRTTSITVSIVDFEQVNVCSDANILCSFEWKSCALLFSDSSLEN